MRTIRNRKKESHLSMLWRSRMTSEQTFVKTYKLVIYEKSSYMVGEMLNSLIKKKVLA